MQLVSDLYDAASKIDISKIQIDEDLDALQLLYETLESEGYQPEDRFEECKAVNFGHRFPMHLSALQVILRDINRSIKDMQSEIERLYELDFKQRKETGAQ